MDGCPDCGLRPQPEGRVRCPPLFLAEQSVRCVTMLPPARLQLVDQKQQGGQLMEAALYGADL